MKFNYYMPINGYGRILHYRPISFNVLIRGNILTNTGVTTEGKYRWRLKHKRVQIGYLAKTEDHI